MPVSPHFNHRDQSFDEHARGTVLRSTCTVSERKKKWEVLSWTFFNRWCILWD